MAACVEVWESDPEALHYHGDGYIALGPASQESDLVEVFDRQQRIGYPSEPFVGEEQVTAHMRSLYPDWRAQRDWLKVNGHALKTELARLIQD
jgi:hypothetical protein